MYWRMKLAVHVLLDCKWGIWSGLSHEASAAQWHVYIPGQGMPQDVGRLTPHVTGLSSRALSPTAPTTCPSLEAPAHGTKFGSKYFVGHEVHFTCSQGYTLAGSATRVCRDNGTWTGTSAVCKGEAGLFNQCVCVWESCYICLQCVFITGLRAFRSHESIHLQTLCRTCWNVFWARTAMSARLFAAEQKIPTPIWGDLGWTESECQAERGCSPRGQTELLAHTQIAGEEKSHSSQRLELLGTVNEALVKTALNVSEHRKTPVLHSTVGSLPLQVSPPCERRWLSYCKINPPLPTSCSCFPASLTAVPLDGG